MEPNHRQTAFASGYLFWWFACTSFEAELELQRGRSASPPNAEQHYARACELGNGKGCQGWLEKLTERQAPEVERIEALRGLCEPIERPYLKRCTEYAAASLRADRPDDVTWALKPACNAGDEEACGWLGGLLVRTDPKQARSLLEKAVRKHPRFKYDLAKLVLDPEEALRLRKEACSAEVAAACGELSPDERGAWELEELARCFLGREEVCGRIQHLRTALVAEPWSSAQFYWLNYKVCPLSPACDDAADAWFGPIADQKEQACLAGDFASCEALGRLLETGRGREEDLPRAASLFLAACEGGQHEACWRYGHALQEGRGLIRNRIEAVSWFDRACEGGSARGCELAGWVRYNGHGVALDIGAAHRLYAKACEGGRCFLYALRLGAGGYGYPKDPEGKQAALRKGCKAGEAESCRQLWHSVYNAPVPHSLSPDLNEDGARAYELAVVGCTDWDPDACRVYALMGDGGMEHVRLRKPGTRVDVATRMCGQGWALGCQLGGDQEKACEMGIRWLCDNIAEEGVKVTYPGIRP